MEKATLYIAGLGPGDSSLLSPMALAAIKSSKVIAGYSAYIDLLAPELLAGRRVIKNGMMGEMARCTETIEAVLAGETTTLVCSGDPGIYALAGLVFELMREKGLTLSDLEVEIIPGIPALCGAAALLGAPLMHDFAVISLSDLLTPWGLIQKRVTNALEADFVLVIYNPRSKKRHWQLKSVLDEVARIRGVDTVAGVVHNAYRHDQSVEIMHVSEVNAEFVDMFSILFIGNSQTEIFEAPIKKNTEKNLNAVNHCQSKQIKCSSDWKNGARMVTPRGYMNKYKV